MDSNLDPWGSLQVKDYKKMLRMAPHKNRIKGLVPRIIPLRKIYEKEVKLYAILEGIEHDMR